MNDNRRAIEHFLRLPKPFIATHGRKNTFEIRDGFVKYVIKINPLSCPCSRSTVLCDHIITILKDNYHLSEMIVTYMHMLLPYFYEYFDLQKSTQKESDGKKNMCEINTYLLDKLEKNVLNDCCGICLVPLYVLGKTVKPMHQCCVCNKFCHEECLRKWLIKKTSDGSCIYCKEKPL